VPADVTVAFARLHDVDGYAQTANVVDVFAGNLVGVGDGDVGHLREGSQQIYRGPVAPAVVTPPVVEEEQRPLLPGGAAGGLIVGAGFC